MREKIRDKGRLEHILESIAYIIDFTDGIDFEDFAKDAKLRFAVIKNMEIIGEASNMLTKEIREQHPEIPWRKIVDLRHVLIHGYYQISFESVWKIIQKDLLPLKEQIQTLHNNEV
jgi:uncharacterized protein with HEPN domain